MAQIAHVSVGDQPVALSRDLGPGCYVGQVGSRPAAVGDEIVFTVGTDVPPTWAKTSAAGLVVPVALALIPS